MKLIIGLGNPGGKYKNNRHNAGRMLIGKMREMREMRALESDVFMNDSGVFVKKALTANRYPLTALYVAHDDLDIPLGEYKIQFGVGPKVHNGVASVEQELGTKGFWRIRIGVDNRTGSGQARMTGERYVLEDFTNEELEILKQVQDDIYEKLKNDFS